MSLNRRAVVRLAPLVLSVRSLVFILSGTKWPSRCHGQSWLTPPDTMVRSSGVLLDTVGGCACGRYCPLGLRLSV